MTVGRRFCGYKCFPISCERNGFSANASCRVFPTGIFLNEIVPIFRLREGTNSMEEEARRPDALLACTTMSARRRFPLSLFLFHFVSVSFYSTVEFVICTQTRVSIHFHNTSRYPEVENASIQSTWSWWDRWFRFSGRDFPRAIVENVRKSCRKNGKNWKNRRTDVGRCRE